MEIIEYDRESSFICRYEDHDFELSRDPNDGFSFGNWYMIVKDETGDTCCEGWIDDSSSIGPLNAMEQACLGADLDPPKQWPSELLNTELEGSCEKRTV